MHTQPNPRRRKPGILEPVSWTETAISIGVTILMDQATDLSPRRELAWVKTSLALITNAEVFYNRNYD